jgi:hypothetical protein
LQNSQTVLKGLDNRSQHDSALGNGLGLSKGVTDGGVLVDFVVKFKLEFLLGHFNEEVTNLLGHGVAHIAENKAEVGVNSVPNLFNKDVLRVYGVADGCWLRVAVGNGPTLGIYLLHRCLGFLSLGHDGATIFLVVLIVGKDVVLLSIDDGFYKLTSMVTLLS